MFITTTAQRILFAATLSLGLASSALPVFAQDAVKPSEAESGKPSPEISSRRAGKVTQDEAVLSGPTENILTLDDVRALPIPEPAGGMSGMGTMGGGMSMGGMGMGSSGDGGMGMDNGMGDMMGSMMYSALPDARQTAMTKVHKLRKQLSSPKANRVDIEEKLRAALSEYFIVDLQHRVKELDEVKAKVTQMEARLQKRLELKQEAIDLQLKRMQYEADGLEFDVPNQSDGSGYGSSSTGEGAGYPGMGMSGGYPGMSGSGKSKGGGRGGDKQN